MKESQSSYRQVMKATSLFGGVQVINIVIQVIRSKVIAVLLGPSGVGIIGLLNSTIGLIASLTNFGLGTSAVKEVANAYSSHDSKKISITITVLRRLVWITGTLGALLVLVFSAWLSEITFGNSEFTFAFAWISVTLLFQQLTTGQLVILQGMRKLKLLAKANVLGSFLGLVVTLPLYYFYGIDGIAPGIVFTALIALILSWFFSSKVTIEKIKISYNQTFREGKQMLYMGFMISLSGLLAMAASYIVRVFISTTGGVTEVGLYTAGFAIINTYTGLIFSAMATDYFPRLSAVSQDNKLCEKTINQQAEIAILILAPILIIFLVFINVVVVVLYSSQFIAVNAMIYWAALGMFFKAISWSIAFIFLAKGVSKLFFVNELLANTYLLSFNILGYFYKGLEGLGISFLISYLLYLIQVYLIAKVKFGFRFEKELLKIFSIQFGLALLTFIIILNFESTVRYVFGTLLILLSVYYSFKQIDKRLDVSSLIKNKFFKNEKK